MGNMATELKTNDLGRRGRSSVRPAKARQAATIIHNCHFDNGPTSLLVYDSSQTSIWLKLQVCWYLGWSHLDFFWWLFWSHLDFSLLLLPFLFFIFLLLEGLAVKTRSTKKPQKKLFGHNSNFFNTIMSIGTPQFIYWCVSEAT